MITATRPKTRVATKTSPPRLLPTTAPVSEMTYPISPEYIERWTAERAIAEVIANAIDADPAGFRVSYTDGVLTIEDYADLGVGAEGMVLGFSDKRGRDDQIGQFGEGLKIATLVLARNPQIGEVFVETVGYAFSPAVVDHAGISGLNIPTKSKVAPKVLCWRLWHSARVTGTRVRIVCPAKTAEGAMARFRQLSDPNYQAPVGNGIVVTDGKPGRIWIGGVLVSERRDLVLSYDLSLARAKVMQNRDRTIIEGWALNQAIGDVLRACNDEVAIRRLVERALDGVLGEGERGFFANIASAELRRILAAIGAERFGKKAVFYLGQSEHDSEAALDLRDRGYQEVSAKAILSYQATPFWKALGVPSAAALGRRQVKSKAQQTTWITDKSQSEAERKILAEAIGIVRATWGADAIERVRVYAETRLETGECSDFLGFYEPGSGVIAIKREQLASLDETLDTLTHEATHRIAHRYPQRVGLDYPDYRDRSRGFEHALGAMAAQAARRLAAAGLLDAASTPVFDEQAQAAARGHAAIPGFTWKLKGDRWRRRSVPALAYATLYERALAGWASPRGIAARSVAAQFATLNFVPAAAVRSLREGGTAGREAQNASDATTPLGLSGGVAWWVTQGVDFVYDRNRLAKRSRHFPHHWAAIWQGFLTEIESLGPDFAALVPQLHALAEGKVAPDLTNAAWQAPFIRLVELEQARSGLFA